VRPGGSELLLGTHCCDLWELNPAAATAGIGVTAATTAASTGRAGSGAAAANVLPEPLIQGHTGDVWGVAYHPLKPHRFATACESDSIFVWHGRRRQLMVSWLQPVKPFLAVLFVSCACLLSEIVSSNSISQH
jgi:WD40 repeat protein